MGGGGSGLDFLIELFDSYIDFGFWGNPGAKVPSFWSKSRLGVGTSRTLELFDKNHSGLRTSPAVLNIEDP